METNSYFNGRITISSDICNGKPAIRNKRITVHTILEALSAGDTQEEILKQFPSLEAEDISACLAFASQLLDHKYALQNIA